MHSSASRFRGEKKYYPGSPNHMENLRLCFFSSRKLDKFPHQALKGQCHEIFDHFKNGFANFFVFAKIFNPKIENRVSV